MIKCIIFDFDGVILESVDVKTEAFRALFSEYPEKVNQIVKFHLDNGGMSRFDKFKFIYKNILKKELDKKEFHMLCDRFSELVLEKVLVSPFVKGVKVFLNACLDKYPMFVVSATPDKEIKLIVKRKNIGKYFFGVFGSPTTKADSIKRILKLKRYKSKEVLFIGDSRNDFKAAKNTKVLFIARATNNSLWLKNKAIKTKIKDFSESRKILKLLNNKEK